MMGFMFVSAFLSMWISNTATTAMMLPIANAVLQQLKDTEMQAEMQDHQKGGETNLGMELDESKDEILEEKQQKDTGAEQDSARK